MQLRFGFSDDEIEAMPLARLAGRLVREEKRVESEKKEWLLGLWLMSRSVADVNYLDREPPYHESEKPPKSSVGEVQRARQSQEAEKGSISEGLSGPSFFGKRYGFSEVFGEPPEPEKKEVLTAEEIKAREREAEARFVEGLRSQVSGRET